MSARDDILARIRAANSGVEVVPVQRAYRRRAAPGVPAGRSLGLLDLLEERLLDYRAAVVRCGADGVAEAVRAFLPGTARVLRAPGAPQSWCPSAESDQPSLGARELDAYAAVVTGAAVACAETGTIALDASADQGRRAITLVPDMHVCVVRADQVVGSVPEMIWRLKGDRPITFISGPSATSDIELDRVEGVHGPRTLCVVLLEDECEADDDQDAG